MKRLVLALASAICAAGAQAQPLARSLEECLAYADLALVASALAKHGIERAKTETLLPDIYQLQTEEARQTAQRIVAAAYGDAVAAAQPRAFAAVVGNACLRGRGRFDALLGVVF